MPWTVADMPDLHDRTVVVTGANTGVGFETVFGTNHLGHLAFTGRVLPALLATPGSRVVTVSSLSHRIGHIPWDDIPGGIAGAPIPTSPARRALDERAQARLWEMSVEMTGVAYP